MGVGGGRGELLEGTMKDVQNQKDHRNVEIQKVGVKQVRYPITVLDKSQGFQHTVATVNMYVNLPRHFKGTHMSRFLEILNRYRGNIGLKELRSILEEMKKKLRAQSAHVEIEFPYFVEKRAPVTGSRGLMEYRCCFYGSSDHSDIDLCLEVNVPISTVCPCSKEISDHGAHNQRGIVRVRVRFKKLVWIEDLIKLVEESASCDLYSILKRPDEKYVTERAYENPMFVEDVVREVAMKLQADPNITWFSVEAENFESIHNHSAYAYVENGLKVSP